ncbi:type-F conjugative transfer system pilin assembly protein TrbC [Candidatus Regiella insecticola]
MQNQPFIDAMQQRQQQQGSGEANPVTKALYFVSFSIPLAGLKQMVHDADQYPIQVTLRGLVNNDLRQTANAVLSLVKEGKRGGVQIDPVSFRTYGITAVPALVVTCQGHFDRVAGNIRLTAALKKVAESGQCAQTAQALLKTAANR